MHERNTGTDPEYATVYAQFTSHEFTDVLDFHQKFGLMVGEEPRLLTKRKMRERIEFLMEELQELIDAAGVQVFATGDVRSLRDLTIVIDELAAPQELADQADALVDLVYVALGTAVMQGLPWEALWGDVQRANMSKVRGVTKRGHAVDVTKPPGWMGPMPALILAQHGFKNTPEGRKEHDDEQGA